MLGIAIIKKFKPDKHFKQTGECCISHKRKYMEVQDEILVNSQIAKKGDYIVEAIKKNKKSYYIVHQEHINNHKFEKLNKE